MFMIIDVESGQPIILAGKTMTFDSGASAAIYARQYGEITGKKAQVRVMVNDNWKEREKARFESGEYQPLAWATATFWLENLHIHENHFAHRSKIKDHCIAYTESPEKGAQDRQTRIKAGAYLTKYFGHVLTESEINHYARLHAALENAIDSEVKFAITANEIEHVYTHGPASCMSDHGDSFVGHCHPVRVYGDSDLQLAYVDRKSDYHMAQYAARALVWPEKKIYGRVYPTPERYNGDERIIARAEHNGLITALEKMGFHYDQFIGAKIKKIKNRHGEGYIMPYLDGTQGLIDHSDHFEISRRGDFDASQTNGLINDEERIECERCGDMVSNDDTSQVRTEYGFDTYCESCVSNHTFHCYGYDQYYSDEVDSVECEGYTYSLRYAEEHFNYCEFESEWISGPVVEVYTKYGIESWSLELIEDHAFVCHSGNAFYSNGHFESVEIDGETYEKQNAIKAGLYSEANETESEGV